MANTPTGGTDIASLGLSVDSVPVVEADKALEHFGQTFDKTIPKMDRFEDSAKNATSTTSKMGAVTIVTARSTEELAAAVQLQSRNLITSAEIMGNANAQIKNRIQLLEAEWKAEQAVIKGEADAAKARIRDAESANSLLVKLNEMVRTYGMNAEALHRYQASMAGVSAQAAPMINQLEMLKAATARYGVSIQSVEQIERARVEYETSAQTVLNAFKRRSLRENAEAEESAAAALNAQRRRTLAENQAAEESAATALAAFKKRTLRENREAAIAEIDRIEAARIAADQREMSAATALAAFKKRTLRENADAEIAIRKETEQAAIRLAEKQAMDEIHWAQLSAKAKYEELAKLGAYKGHPSISQEKIDSMFSKSAQGDLHNMDKHLKEYLSTLSHTRREHVEGAHAGRGFADMWEQVRFGSSRARSELIVLIHEMTQGRFTRIPGSLMVFAEYTNLSAIAMSGFGLAIAGTLTALGLMAYAVIGAEAQVKKLNDSLNRSNAVSGLTARGLTDIAEAAGKIHGNFTDAYEASAKLASSGKFTADQLAQIIPVVTKMEHHFGGSLADSIKEFESLVVRSSTKGIQSALGVSRALLDLNDKYHFLNVSQIEAILQMEKEGRMREASALAIKLYTAEGERATTAAEKYMGKLERGWHNVTNAIGSAKQALLNWGKADAVSKNVAAEQTQRTKIDFINKADWMAPDIKKQNLALANAELNRLTKEKIELDKVALVSGEKQRRNDEAMNVLRLREIEDDQLMKKSKGELTDALEKFKKQNDIIEAARPGYLREHAKYLAEREAAIIKAHTKKESKGPDSGNLFSVDTRVIDDQMALVEKAVDDNERLIKNALAAKVLAEEVAYSQMNKNRQDELKALEVWYKSRKALLDQYESKLKPVAYKKAVVDLDSDYDKKLTSVNSAMGTNESTRLNNEKIDYDKLVEKQEKGYAKELEAMDKLIERQSKHNEEIGKTKEQVELAREAREQAYMSAVAQEAEEIMWLLEKAKIWGGMDERETDYYTRKLDHLNKLIDKSRELAGLHGEGADLESTSPNKLSNDADKLSKQWKNAGDVIGKSLSEGFGKGGKAVGDMFKIMANNQARQSELNKNLIKEQAAAVGLKNEEVLIAQANDRYNAQTAQNRMNEYGSMTSAAAGFFDEQSKGYKALMVMSQIFHAAELAMTVAELVPKALAAVLNQGSGDPYTAFGRMAAMAAVVAGLGIAVGAIGGGGAAPKTSAERQAQAGTGSILGDDKAKSESILKALEIMQKNSGLGLVHTESMTKSLHTIANSFAGLSTMIIRMNDLGKITSVNENGSVASAIRKSGQDPATMILDKLSGGFVTKVSDKIANALFGGKKTTIDTGIDIGSKSVSEIMRSGVDANQYSEVKIDGGIFGKDKYRPELVSVGSEINSQLTKVIVGMSEEIKSSAVSLGIGGDSFNRQLESFVIDIGKMSFTGLTGDQIKEQLQNSVSKLGDDMVKFAFKDLSEFQLPSEGLFETMARLTNNLIQVKDVFAILGKDFNRTGLDAIKFSDNLIEFAGGIEELTSGTKAFVDAFISPSEALIPVAASLRTALDGLGMSSVVTMDQFKQQTIAAFDGTIAGNGLYTTLLKLAPAFAQVTKAEEERYSKMLGLKLQIANLEGDEVVGAQLLNEIRNIELGKMDESLRPLQSRVWMLEDEKKATEAAENAHKLYTDALDKTRDGLMKNAETALDAIDRVIKANKDYITKQYNDEVESVKKVTALSKDKAQAELKLAQDAKNEIKGVFDSLTNAMKSTEIQSSSMDEGRRKEAQRYLASVDGTDLTKATGLKAALEDIAKPSKAMFVSFLDYARDQAQTASVVGRLKGQSGQVLSEAEKQIQATNDLIKLIELKGNEQLEAMKTKYEADLEVQDKIFEDAKNQLDVLKGIDTGVKDFSVALREFASSIAAIKAHSIVASAATPGDKDRDAIESLYTNLLGRGSDKEGLDFWTNALKQGTTIASISDQFTTSPEYQKLHPESVGTFADSSKIEKLYETLLNRKSDAEGLQFWTNALKEGFDMGHITQQFKESPEYKKLNSLDIGTNYVKGDQLAKIHDGERVMPKADNRELMSRLSQPAENNRALMEEIRALRAEVVNLRLSNTEENGLIRTGTDIAANKLKRIEGGGITIKAGTV